MNQFQFRFTSIRYCMFIATLVSAVVYTLAFTTTSVSAQAVNNTGPADPTTRYALEDSFTTTAININVPVYFPTQPTTAKVVNVNDFRLGQAGIYARFCSVNRAPTVCTPVNLSADGSFSIPAGNFAYDPVAALWKANITAQMLGYSGAAPSHYIHFRMALADASGYMSFGGGPFQAVSRDYPDRTTARAYSLYMATPCNVRVNTANNISFVDLDNRDYDNGFFPVTVRVYDITGGANTLIAERIGDSYPTAMGDGDTLTVGMTFVPGHRYRVDLSQIAATNVIRYNFPYDNIAYVVPVCPTPQWNTSGSSTASPTGVVSTTVPSVTFTHAVTNLSSSLDPTDKTITAEIFQTINGGAPTSRGVFTRASGLPPGGNFSRDDTVSTSSSVGQVICQYMRWSPAIWNSSAARQTPQVCVTIAAVPRISIVGGDAASGGNYACSTGGGGFTGSASSPGSFGEYGVLSTGNIVNFYSAATTGGSVLTFANTTPTQGNFAGTRCLTDLTPGLTGSVASWNPGFTSGQAIPSGTNNYKVSGNVSIGATTLNAGDHTIVDARGHTVTIEGNLQYANGPYANFSQAPSLVILADRILINSNVTTVDGLFIASQNFTTCREAGDTHAGAAGQLATMATGGPCRSSRLTINGALIVGNQLVTARSIGGGSASEQPAEIIRFRPEVFLTPYEKGVATGSLMTDIETELPPRN